MLFTIPIALVLGFAAAAPMSTPSFLFRRGAGSTAASQLEIIAPTSNTCGGALFADECETAATAGPYLIDAMQKYKIYSPAEIVAILSLVAYETGDFKFSKNHYPGRPGQGTRNMQMANYNLEYAMSIPALKSAALAIAPQSTTTGLSDDQLNQIRALVLSDEYAWASAAWFLTTQCASIRTQLQTGGQSGWEAYLGCVGTTATSDRLAYWTRANTAFGIS
ncbi:MAG: hypothetical protein M1818_000760 [Claussenomyces sp. TS43310]|nr:MAG: hypothetical protein M1818_000760 [Claussenomyces sp. TS43310]